MAKRKSKKEYAWFYSTGKKLNSYDFENPYQSEKEVMEEALMDLDIGTTVSIYKAEIKKVGSFKQKLVKV
jgi:hypothetical protein